MRRADPATTPVPPPRRGARAVATALLPLAAVAIGVGCAAARSGAQDDDAGGALTASGASIATGAPSASGRDALTLERIMGDPQWIARSPSGAYWADDSLAIYFRREREGEDDVRDLYEHDLLTGETRRVPDEELSRVDARGDFNRERTAKLIERHGDLFVKDLATGVERQLTRTSERESATGFLLGSETILFERDGQLLARDLADGFERDVVAVEYSNDPELEEDDDPDYLGAQQERLFASIAEGKRRAEASRARSREVRDADPTRAARPIYVGDGWRELSRSLSPDGRWLALAVTKSSRSRGQRDSMPAFVTESSWVEHRDVRAHVGFAERDDARLMLVDIDGRAHHELSFEDLPLIADDPLAFLDVEEQDEAVVGDPPADDRDGAEAGSEEGADDDGGAAAPAGEPRPVTASGLSWAPDGSRAAVALRSHDNKDRWIVALERDPPSLRLVHHRRDEAWVGWNGNGRGWLDDGSLWFTAEDTGYAHLYHWDPATGATRALTEGEYEVSGVVRAHTTPHLYYRANVDHPGVYDVWRVDLETGAREQLTDLPGRTGFRLSPDEQWLLLDNDRALRPTELYVQATRPGADARRLTFTVEPDWAALPWVRPEFVAVPGDHGRPIWSRLYRPPADVAGAPGTRPAVLFVHGAGYLQNAHQGWSSYFREFMFHSLLAHRGYVVLDMDYRASAGYGRDWRTAIYRDMGTPELEDLIDGVEWLVANHGVDPERVGLYGGSYGGFMALMAMFKAPATFAAGAALRPVTDWAHYNHSYTANILNTPERDPEAFERSSPIEFAEGLEGALLICHGMVDDNVLAKDSIRLAQRLIELGKDGWELALYPVEPHSFTEPASWRDEYSRILQLFEEHLRGVDARGGSD